MKNFKDRLRLNISGAVLDKNQLCEQMKKLASDNIIMQKSSKETYPIPMIEDDFEVIKQTYKLLNNHVKIGIPIHPAGEWILDNFYIIDENVKAITKELTLKKYTNFLGLANGEYAGFARVYVLASEMIAYTDGKIEYENLEYMLEAYQNKKTLNMDEIWNIGLFIQIVLIQKIRKLCESIYLSQMQKYKAEVILSKFFKDENDLRMLAFFKIANIKTTQMKNTFIEYMSYKLKKYGRKAYSYLSVLEEVVDRAGGEISEIIKKEHFEIAVKKVSMGNSIISLKNISRINFTEIFEHINGVEEILKQDPSEQYEKMDMNTKIYYRNAIQELAKKTKISEIYITKKALNLSKEAYKKNEELQKCHIGYYLIADGRKELLESLEIRKNIGMEYKTKVNFYIYGIWSLTLIILIGMSCGVYKYLINKSQAEAIIFTILTFLGSIVLIENIVSKIVQSVLSKIVKPKLIPKLDFQGGIPEEYSTMVVIPTIIKDAEKIRELADKLEVYYIANKSENLYFTILGDCSSAKTEQEDFDNSIISEGLNCIEKLNKKYPSDKAQRFNFVYRKRIWSNTEECFMGWERKRGLINQFNEYCLGKIENPFRANTLEDERKITKERLKIKYIITLDSDTELTLNSGIELVGAMAHILNRPMLNSSNDLVVQGHALMQPRVGIGLLESRISAFTKIFAGTGGTDSYTSSISDTYEDNFDEGIFTGKGIYELETFEKVLSNEIRENTVLSHDLLEGSYLRAGLISDILLMDGFPSNYLSYRTRLARWIRGDYQIIPWIKGKITDRQNKVKKNPLNKLSKYKIFSNIVRSKQESSALTLFILFFIINIVTNKKIYILPALAVLSVIIPFIIDLVNEITQRENRIRTKEFTKSIDGLSASFLRAVLDLATIPDKAILSIKSEIKALYRMNFSKKHLLEWTTSEEAEKNTKQDILTYYSLMKGNAFLGIFISILAFFSTTMLTSAIGYILGVLWLLAPSIMKTVGTKIKEKNKFEELDKSEKEYIFDVGRKTWQYFKDNINEKSNFLPPDNYQEDRKQKVVERTSSTNIGLGLLAVISSYDLEYENLEDTINLLYKMLQTISILQKWNGHLYNWYNTKTLEPLIPRYVSLVDSGNFIGYLYVTKQFLLEIQDKNMNVDTMIMIINNIIENTNFRELYNERIRLFSVGFNIEEDKLTDSYYDLLASEARQASFVAIAKKDISEKHWYNLSRTLTTLNKYKGLVSWSGTAFEYLMPTINIPGYPGSILEESCRFMIMSQIEYAKRLGIPWGISEAAFNLKDLNNNYQYKAFGIPWLGLKRGLEEEIVVASYGSILALNEIPKEVVQNMKKLEKLGMYGKYGFFESIDFTPGRNSKKYSQVKTFMAHHQGLILLSINNLINNKIFQTRFMKNPEMMAINILLEERMPQDMIITKEEKEKIEKIKYVDYEDYAQRKYSKINDNLNISNIIANDKYTIVMDQYGNGYSNYRNIQINRFKGTDDIDEGILFYLKNIKNKKVWTNTITKFDSRPEKYNIIFAPEMNKFIRTDGNIETTTKVIVDTDEPVEIRNLTLKNIGNTDETLEVTSFIEPIISNKFQDYSHKAFNNLFLRYEYIEEIETILVERKARTENDKDIFMAVNLYSEDNNLSKLEFEIDKEKFFGRNNFEYPKAVKNSTPLSSTIGYTIDPIVAMRRTITINKAVTCSLNLIIVVGNSREEVIKNVVGFMNNEKINRTFELLRAKSEAENRYLGIKGRELETYQKLLTHLMFPSKTQKRKNVQYVKSSDLWKFGISGDNPILLLKIKEIIDIDILKEVLKAYEFFRVKNIKIDLIIINDEKESYENIVRDEVMSAILNRNLEYLLNISGGIFILNNLDESDRRILDAKANLILNANYSSLSQQIDDIESRLEDEAKEISKDYILNLVPSEENDTFENNEFKNLKYFNEYGGFSEDGREYLIKINRNFRTPAVWSNILVNKKFGTLTTESMGGYTWYKNSRLNRLTAWSNNSLQDVPSEVIYVKDMGSRKKWSLGASPMPDDNDYYITYGMGYTKYFHYSSKIKQELRVFVPKNDNIKISVLTLENQNSQKKKLKFIYYIKPVLGEDEIKTNTNIGIKYKSNMIIAQSAESDLKMFVSSSEKISSYTGSKNSFFKGQGLNNPEGLDDVNLSYENSYSQDGIIAIELFVELGAFSKKEISFQVGVASKIEDMQELSYKYSNISNCKSEYINCKRYWNDLVNTLQVKVPIESMNIMLNGWLIYQSITARLYGRTGFYQSGGAYGFRDQLQDTLALKYINPEFEKNEIIKHAENQFVEGDVQHWWHEESSRGIRTRMSDDMLWLPFVTSDYIEFTNDYSILTQQVPYREGKLLQDGELERYDLYGESSTKESLYNHCIRAIEKGINIGENGLPKIGTGDWNDGMSNVGAKGKGESVWLGFFLYNVLDRFIPICEFMNDIENVQKYKEKMMKLKKSLNNTSWDGRWYRRAFTDDGDVLGSLQNEECRIDSIAQSWSVISGAGDNDKKFIAMESLENHLVDKEIGIIKLLDPPFDKTKINPGYIKSYLPGTRENGGQYTHECCC